jgi:hypothetical protein
MNPSQLGNHQHFEATKLLAKRQINIVSHIAPSQITSNTETETRGDVIWCLFVLSQNLNTQEKKKSSNWWQLTCKSLESNSDF